ncbi:hypothetical protein [Streptomyces orinoci]|uniref:Uncharacterized protein n=1 Tax=Streptomyces orinoci TaxID=67339 RepID=A0ABV3K7K2_STRON|nr:hypothetical protein [Streptomyces orinoci]
MTAGIAVYDRRSGAFVHRLNTDLRFRSASLVKLLIALDRLDAFRSARAIGPGERERLGLMLRSSDDAVASRYWDTEGGSAVLTRTGARLGLRDLGPPPPEYPGHWGYTALTAADTVRVYRYLLEQAPDWVRELVLGELRAATPRGTDGCDQSFGIPAAFRRPWAVKQGWSGFEGPGEPVLHSTGTVGEDDRCLVAVLTRHPAGTGYRTACARVTALCAGLTVPGAVTRS